MNAIEIHGLKKAYADFQLGPFDLSLPDGTIMGLVGENGAGKSTTIRLIMDAVRRDGGSVCVLGTDNRSAEFRAVKQEVGVVLDEAYFPEVLTAANVGRVMRRTYKNWDDSTFNSYVQRFSLPTNKMFRDFSRGMKMKFAIAAALSHSPRLLILDEATSGLDPMVRDEILDLFNDFTRDETHSVLISSHIVSDLEKICDYVAFLHRGKLLFCEEKDRLPERFAVVKVSAEDESAIPAAAVIGKKATPFGAELLIRREQLPASFTPEHATLEDIIILMAKGDDNK